MHNVLLLPHGDCVKCKDRFFFSFFLPSFLPVHAATGTVPLQRSDFPLGWIVRLVCVCVWQGLWWWAESEVVRRRRSNKVRGGRTEIFPSFSSSSTPSSSRSASPSVVCMYT